MKENKFLEIVNQVRSVLIILSLPLDYDCLGSGLILKKYLESLGKKVRVIYPAEIRENDHRDYRYLPYFKEVESKDTRQILSSKNADLLILVDGTSLVQFYDSSKTEIEPPDISAYNQIIHIDHHTSHFEKLGTLEIINPQASSTCEIVINQILPPKLINKQLATLGYAAIVGDTGNFKWSVSPQTFKTAALLFDKGADKDLILDKYFFNKTKQFLMMTAVAINQMTYDSKLGTVFLFVPHSFIAKHRLSDGMIDDLNKAFKEDLATKVVGYPRGILIYERTPGFIGVSCRGNNLGNQVNLAQLCRQMGNGGGHFNAAGVNVEGEFEAVKAKFINFLKSSLDHSSR